MVDLKRKAYSEAEAKVLVQTYAPVASTSIKDRDRKGKLKKPPQFKERLQKVIDETSIDSEFKKIRDFEIEEMKKDGYILLDKWNDILRIFGEVYIPHKKDFSKGSKMFFVWEYSALLNILPEYEQKALELLAKIESNQLLKSGLNNLARENHLYETAYFINPVKKEELSTADGKLKEVKENGSYIWIKNEKGINYPLQRNCELSDLSYNAIVALLGLSGYSLDDLENKEIKLEKKEKNSK